ncbi:Fe(3+) ions import ATP-binding protein FbpC [Marinobacterium nitratireducens]|uniref:Fe(3+) ions import ATP-binding protein FbpC n=1 Tax=Marinobacterium nitratireducens TaxID=518897 RepID=A0A917Z7Q5_9GAMM|nr:putative 2-aminoethylphosphonate ABC transporter ATP-binding protein [Marinobacterium nitratireducens]GGO75422.1 Fe(3+) ions import ATP-binding protein FbpC [Marinobacterium nitratireducens]
MSQAHSLDLFSDQLSEGPAVDGGAAQMHRTPSPPYLQVFDLVKKYGTFSALDGVSLAIAAGEFISFLGPSGCGKTTLLRAIAGLDFQTSGSLYQDGADISWLPPDQRDFGIVFQSYALFPNLTVAENIAYGLENQGTKKHQIAERVAGLLNNVGLPGAEKRFPGQLSGGQQQRVALARALAPSPNLLLLDEPLSALDARVRVHLRREIKALQHRLGITTIMVTHDQEEAMTMADRIVVMNQGRIEQIGTPREIYENPVSVFVAQFVGTINLLPFTPCGPDTVEVAGLKFRCPHSGRHKGTGGVLAIRPEDIECTDVHDHDANCIDVRVESSEFLGATMRLKLVQGPDLALIADVPIRALRGSDIRPGQAMRVRLDAERIRLFDEAGNC